MKDVTQAQLRTFNDRLFHDLLLKERRIRMIFLSLERGIDIFQNFPNYYEFLYQLCAKSVLLEIDMDVIFLPCGVRIMFPNPIYLMTVYFGKPVTILAVSSFFL